MADNKKNAQTPTRKAMSVENSIKTASFPVSPTNWYHGAVLTEVFYEEKEGSGDNEGTLYDTVNFVFRGDEYITEGDNPHVPRFVLTEFAVLEDAKSGTPASKLIEYQDKRVAQIFDTYVGLGKNAAVNNGKGLGYVEGKEEATWAEYYKSVANSFNTAKKGEPVYKTADGKYIRVWLKLTYAPNGQLQVPLGNFIDVIREGRTTLLRKGQDNQYIMPVRERKNPNSGANAANIANEGAKPLPKGFN